MDPLYRSLEYLSATRWVDSGRARWIARILQRKKLLTNFNYFALLEYRMVQRRQLLAGVGIATIGGLAGCSSSDNTGSSNSGSESNNEGSSNSNSTNQGNEEPQPQETQGNEPSEYPTKENNGFGELDTRIEEDSEAYGFMIEDFDYLNLNDISGGAANGDKSYDQALYDAVNFEGGTPDAIYLAVTSHEHEDTGNITVYIEDDGFDPSDGQVGHALDALENVENGEVDLDEVREDQEEFFSERIDPDGSTHAVDLADSDYAVDALHSGFGSE